MQQKSDDRNLLIFCGNHSNFDESLINATTPQFRNWPLLPNSLLNSVVQWRVTRIHFAFIAYPINTTTWWSTFTKVLKVGKLLTTNTNPDKCLHLIKNNRRPLHRSGSLLPNPFKEFFLKGHHKATIPG